MADFKACCGKKRVDGLESEKEMWAGAKFGELVVLSYWFFVRRGAEGECSLWRDCCTKEAFKGVYQVGLLGKVFLIR